MNEPSITPAKMKTTLLERKRRGIVLRKVAIAMPPDLVARFRARCALDGVSMSARYESWTSEFLASLEAPK